MNARRGGLLVLALALAAAQLTSHASPAFAQSPAPVPSADSPAPNATPSPFDGQWFVVLTCAAAADGALGYTYRFEATVADGFLHGERGMRDKPGWLRLDGTIAADGTATLFANGYTGRPEYSVDRVASLTPYGYHVKARFDGKHGSGTRIELRPCTLQFERIR